MSECRSDLRNQFIESHGFNPANLAFLASDMSLRQYYRLKDPRHVLMDAPAPENPHQFIAVAYFLRECGVRAPFVLNYDLKDGFVLLEDFGDQTFTKILKTAPEKEQELYTKAILVLKHLQQHARFRPDFIPFYAIDKLLAEVEVFIDWAWLAFKKEEPSPALKQDYMKRWREVFKALPSLPLSLVLRDYHVDNLMVIEGQTFIERCGLLDFQDALWGPVVYDVVSLLEDARRDITPELVEEMWQLFLEDVEPNKHEDYRTAAMILGAGRHVKIIGVFTRYAICQGKKDYLKHLPRLWKYIENTLNTPALEPIKEWFEEHLPATEQGIPDIL